MITFYDTYAEWEAACLTRGLKIYRMPQGAGSDDIVDAMIADRCDPNDGAIGTRWEYELHAPAADMRCAAICEAIALDPRNGFTWAEWEQTDDPWAAPGRIYDSQDDLSDWLDGEYDDAIPMPAARPEFRSLRF